MKAIVTMLTIDPGTRKTGWALWTLTGTPALLKYGLCRAGKNTWDKRCHDIVMQLLAVFDGQKVKRVVVELPRHYSGGVGGAARNSGAILKLTFLVGMIVQAFRDQGSATQLLPVQTWKGNVPKRITEKRCRRRWQHCLRKAPATSDVWDAIGIGDWVIRRARN